jgi:hypothetical protein
MVVDDRFEIAIVGHFVVPAKGREDEHGEKLLGNEDRQLHQQEPTHGGLRESGERLNPGT